jgi:N-methylhydantoinase A
VEMVGLHLIASAEVGKLEMKPQTLTDAPAAGAEKGRRMVDYAQEGRHEAIIYDCTKLRPGMVFAGPAIIEDPGTTVVIHPGNRVTVDGFLNIIIATSV